MQCWVEEVKILGFHGQVHSPWVNVQLGIKGKRLLLVASTTSCLDSKNETLIQHKPETLRIGVTCCGGVFCTLVSQEEAATFAGPASFTFANSAPATNVNQLAAGGYSI